MVFIKKIHPRDIPNPPWSKYKYERNQYSLERRFPSLPSDWKNFSEEEKQEFYNIRNQYNADIKKYDLSFRYPDYRNYSEELWKNGKKIVVSKFLKIFKTKKHVERFFFIPECDINDIINAILANLESYKEIEKSQYLNHTFALIGTFQGNYWINLDIETIDGTVNKYKKDELYAPEDYINMVITNLYYLTKDNERLVSENKDLLQKYNERKNQDEEIIRLRKMDEVISQFYPEYGDYDD